MATWTGEAWLGSDSGRQKVSVQSETFHGAKQQIEQIYGATDVWNLREENDNNSESSWGDIGGGFTLLLGGMAVVAFFMFLPYILGFGVIGLIGWGIYKLIKWIIK